MEEELRFAALSILRGFRQGLYYGTKIRLPHSIVMTLLFNRSSNIRDMLDRMTKFTWEHSRNLALFVGFYKACLAVARLIRIKIGDKISSAPGLPTTQLDAFLAAALVGHFVWGSKMSSVNLQIVMYLFSRVLMGLGMVLSQKGVPVFKDLSMEQVYPYFASIVWGLVLWLFEYYPKQLQSSLTGSMEELYHVSNNWGAAEDFLPTPATAAVFVYLTLRAREELVGKKA